MHSAIKNSAAAALFLALSALAAAGQSGRTPLPDILSDADHENWRAIGRINVGGFRSKSTCTGTLVAVDLVLTAAHCVVAGTGLPYPPEQVHFVAGWLRGGFVAHRTGSAITFPGGTPDATPGRGQDLALIQLAEPVAADKATPVPLGWMGEAEPPFSLIAYRRDRPHALSNQPDCHPLSKTDQMLGLSCPVVSGNSGAPVLGRINGQWHVLAVMSASVNRSQWIKSLAVIPDAAFRALIPAPD